MQPIHAPVSPNAPRALIAQLQEALALFLSRAAIDLGERERERFALGLREERAQYGDFTRKLVSIFQEQRGLEPSGEVDERTADAMNALLRELGALDPQTDFTPVVAAIEGQTRKLEAITAGTDRLISIDQKLGALGRMPDLGVTERGEAVRTLQSQLARLGVDLPTNETDDAVFGVGTRAALLQLQEKYDLARTGRLDDATRHTLETLAGSVAHPRRIEGRILLENGLPASGVRLRVIHKGFGESERVLGEIETDARGFYALPYGAEGGAANLEVHALDDAGAPVRLSSPVVDADRSTVLNLVAPTAVKSLTSEYGLMAGDLARAVGDDLTRLAEAREDDARQDVSLLHQTTGWDARLIALAAQAAQASAATGLPQAVLYGALRAGLPEDPEALAQVSDDAFATALERATEAGVVTLDAAARRSATQDFGAFKQAARRKLTAPGALSSLGDLLDSAPVETQHRSTFERLALAHDDDDPADLWKAARAEGIPEAQIDQLQLQGKLAYLTLNNAPLTAALQRDLQTQGNLPQLVEQDLHRASAWETRLKSMASPNGVVDNERLARLIPSAYDQTEVAARLTAYAEDMARQVRQTYPSQVIRRRIETDDLKLGARHGELKAPVQAFLKTASAVGFQLGRVPVAQFLKQQGDAVFAGVADEQRALAEEGARLLTRVYQMTPNDESMAVLLDLGFTSAWQVAAIAKSEFVERYWERFGSRLVTERVWEKSSQITSVTFNVFTLAKKIESTPPVLALSGTADQHNQAKENLSLLLKDYPTMESLFGSLDFCECEHCRSVLSPAAYLVDLLRFIDPSETVWAQALTDWKNRHNGKAYDGPDYNYLKPYDALVSRRPDLAHLALTCENTNTVVPYIDLVNEILEYYVAHGQLDAGAAYDTGTATTAELAAEPHHVIPAAYDALRQARYPLGLPFDLWLETSRRFCEHFEVPLWHVLDVFRPEEALFAPTADPTAYGRAQVWAESLGLSPDEVALFTDANFAEWPKLFGYDTQTEAQALAALKSAKTLADRLGVTYRELVDLVQTDFVNPRLDSLRLLHTLDLDVSAVVRYKTDLLAADDKTAFEQKLADATLAYQTSAPGFDAAAWLETAWTTGAFAEALLLRDAEAGCSFDQTQLMRGDGGDVSSLDVVRLNLFVRLWRRLGWTLAETDRALRVCLPSALALDLTTLGTALKSALIHLAHVKELTQLLPVGKNGRLALTALWADLPSRGRGSLYAQLFLTRSILKDDPAFDHPLGHYLSTAGVLLKDHLHAVQAALGLTADEVARILDDANTGDERDPDKASLSLANVSQLYRYRWLARALKLSVSDLIALKTLSGLNPFHPLHSGALTTLADDHALAQTLAFVKAVQLTKAGPLKVEDLTYLFRHRFDPSGPYRPDGSGQAAMLRALATTLRVLAADYAEPADADALTDDVLKARLLQVYPPDVVETFMGFWSGQAVYSATVSPVPPQKRVSPAVYQLPGVSLAYDETRQRQQASHAGVLTEAARTALLAQAPVPAPGDQDALDARQTFSDLLDALVAKSKALFKQFFDAHFDGLLTFDDFFGAGVVATPTEKRLNLLKIILPYLHRRLALQAVVQALAPSTGSDAALLEVLLTDPALLAVSDDPAAPLLSHLTGLGQSGWSAETYATNDLTGPTLATLTVDVGVAAGSNRNSGRWRAIVEVPVAGAYRFYARLGKQNAAILVRCEAADGSPVTDPAAAGAVVTGIAGADNAELSGFVDLKPGLAYTFVVEARDLQNGGFELAVKGEATARTRLSQAPFAAAPTTAFAAAARATILVSKAVQLIRALGLSVRELRHILSHPADFGGADLRLLPTAADDAQMVALWKAYEVLLHYGALKRDWSGGSDDLIVVFESARAAAAPAVASIIDQIAALTRRPAATVADVAAALKLTTTGDFGAVASTLRLWQALQIVETFGVRMASLKPWLTARPDAAVAKQIRDAVKSRYERDAWHRIGKAIFDPLRARQRDALVAHILHQNPALSSTERLFEYFLIDPGMEPVVQTSRLRLAISSLQTFIQRCFLNLEKRVHPSMLNGNHWAWMKRYRVWEANRKIFLFPENWLEPEWRDDKTHLYQELEGKLLQGDVTTDLAEDALYGYLRKLDQLARLEIVTMYAEERPLAPTTLHVIGRTYSQPRQYFYRRYAHQMWTPWEPVSAEIEGDHLVAVMWRERLHLFWLTFMEKVESTGKPRTTEQGNLGSLPMSKLVSAAGSAAAGAATRTLDVQLSWSEYFQGEWTNRETSGFGNVITPSQSFEPRNVFLSVHKEFDPESGVESAVWINLHGLLGVEQMMVGGISMKVNAGYRLDIAGGGAGSVSVQLAPSYFTPAFRVVGKNSRPQYTSTSATIASPYSAGSRSYNQYVSSGSLSVTFVQTVVTTDGARKAEPAARQTILKKGNSFALLPTSNRLTLPNAEFAPLISPLFYADDANTFFVEPSLTETTVDQWEGYAIPRPTEKPKWQDYIERGPKLGAVIPPRYYQEAFKIPKGDPQPDPIDPRALHALKPNLDLVTQPDVAVQFGGSLIDGAGRVHDVAAAGIKRVVTRVGGAF